MDLSHNHLRDVTDKELIENLFLDDTESFEELYNRYWEKLYRYGFKLFRNDEICRDIVQEVFLDVWRRRDQLVIDNVSSFMYQMVKFQLAKHIRKSKSKDLYLDTLNEVNFVCTLQEEIEFNELQEHLNLTLSGLPEKCRNVFYLSRFENLSNKEIGGQMNIAVSTVEKHIHKALKYIRNSLDEFQ